MVDQFYEDSYVPFLLKVAALNYKKCKKMELTKNEKKFYQILHYAIPLINRLCEHPDMTIETVIEDTNSQKKEKHEAVENTVHHQTIHINTSHLNYANSEPEDFDTKEFEPEDEKTAEILNELDEKVVNLINNIREKNRWVLIFTDDLEKNDAEESYEFSEEAEIFENEENNENSGVEMNGEVEAEVDGEDHRGTGVGNNINIPSIKIGCAI